MKYLLFLSILILSMTSYSQKWDHIYGNTGSDESFTDIIEHYDHGYLIASFYAINNGCWLLKTDINGSILWEKFITWPAVNIYGGFIGHDNEGNILVATVVAGEPSGYWPMIMKLDSCGNKVWCRVFQDYDNYNYGWFNDVLVLDNGDILALGELDSEEEIEKIFLWYIESDGNLKWRQGYASQNNYSYIRETNCDGIRKYGDNYIIHGHCYYPYPSDTTHFYQRPLFILLDSLFNEEWIIPFGVNDSIVGKAFQNSYAITDNNGDYSIYTSFESINPNDIKIFKFFCSYPSGDSLFIDKWSGVTIPENIILEKFDLSMFEPNNETLTIEAGETVTWDNLQSLPYIEITIEPGAQLTVLSDTYLNKDTRIIVQRGGELIIDGGGLIGSCMWKGIEVWGNAALSQSSDEQGLVKIINEGKIENAKVAIRTCKIDVDPTEGEEINYNYTGGILQATDANFVNNQISVIFYDYNFPSQSNFSDCDFIVNENYNGEFNPGYFIKMYSMNGIDFTYCRFKNESNNNCYGSGIYGFNSGFKVEGKCVSGTHPCEDWEHGEFLNLKRGIYTTSGGTVYFPEISHTNFIDNHRGVYFSAMQNGSIKNCTITTGPICAGGSYGIYLDNSTGYTIEENHIYEGGAEGIGMVINNSGRDANRIYRNYFDGLKFGIIAQNRNRSKYGTPGLELKCNTYDNMQWDKLVLWEGTFTSEMGIAENQGSSSSNPEDMAGNLFDDHGDPDGDFDDINNEANQITYYIPQYTDDGDVIPVDFTQNSVFLEIMPNVFWSYEDGCPPEDDPGGGGGIGDTKGKMTEAGQKIDSTENLLLILIDGGNTEAVQFEVETSIPPETMEVYNELMNKSPYLSDTVVSTAIEKENVLPGAMIRDIMVANPHTAKSNELMNKLDERWDPLPEYMKAQILQGRSIVSIREETESQLAAFKQQKSKALNALVRYYLNDTLNQVASIDSLIALLENENSVSAKYSLAFLSGEQEAWGMGFGVLNNIPVQFELTPGQIMEHQQYLAQYNLLMELDQLGKTIFEVDSIQIEALQTIEQTDAGQASAFARSMLIALDELEYDEPILVPDILKSSAAMVEYEELLSKANETPGYMTTQPNPAKNYVIAEYDLENKTGAVLEIHNINGNLKYQRDLQNQKNQFTIDTRDWKSGVYIAVLKIKGKCIESVKFTIIE